MTADKTKSRINIHISIAKQQHVLLLINYKICHDFNEICDIQQIWSHLKKSKKEI